MIPIHTRRQTAPPRIARGQRFNEVQAKEVARTCGIPVPEERMAADPSSAARAAEQVGFPVAVKVVSAVGVVRDPVFGPVVMFGLGGMLVELMRDVAFRLAPVDQRQAREMIRETRGARLLEGFRGAPEADLAALARAIVAVSELAAANADSLLTLELNPLRVRPAGQGVIALDAVIETQSS